MDGTQKVWIAYDYEDVVAVAATQARARRAAEQQCSDQVDKGYFAASAAEKRYRWLDDDHMEIYSGNGYEWHGTGFWVRAYDLLTETDHG